MTNESHNRRRLWLSPEEFSALTNNATITGDGSNGGSERTMTEDTYDTIFRQFSSKPDPKSLGFYLSSNVVLVQEFVLTCFVLAGHRAARMEELEYTQRLKRGIPTDIGIRSTRLLTSLGLIWLTLVVNVVQIRFANSKRYTIRYRLTDFLLMAILLRFLSSVLKTLTASYSSDTVYALSTMSLFLHLLTCDYDYANGLKGIEEEDNDQTESRSNGNLSKGKKLERPTFEGGMMSLTSAFFATTLLASRLESNAAVYVFVCSSVILFALYPAARHLVAVKAAEHIGRWGKSDPFDRYRFVNGLALCMGITISLLLPYISLYANKLVLSFSAHFCFRNSNGGTDYLVGADRNVDGIDCYGICWSIRTNVEVSLTIL